MFVSQAHSFHQQARLAVTLAWVAGYTNIIAILACGTVISHATGTTSNLGRDLSEGSWGLAGFALFTLATFFLGACISGYCTELGRRRGWESIYVLPIVLETGLLGSFAFGTALYGPDLTQAGPILYLMVGTASCAMGLQNATIARISNGDVRTTHVTGVLTDLGLETSRLAWWFHVRKSTVTQGGSDDSHHHPWRRLVLLFSVIGTFALGAGLGTLAFDRAPQWAMFVPVAFLAWVIYQDVVRPIAEIEPFALDHDGRDLHLPETLAVYHLEADHDRTGRQRIPNLLAWADRLPFATRVIILDIHNAGTLDENGVLELHALLERLNAIGKQLILAGLNGEQYRQLHLIDRESLLSLDNVCPDLELAIARGLVIAHDNSDSTRAS